jgi:hypothetical protein
MPSTPDLAAPIPTLWRRRVIGPSERCSPDVITPVGFYKFGRTRPFEQWHWPRAINLMRPARSRSVIHRYRPVIVLVGRWTGSMGEGLAMGFDATDA